MKALSKRAFSLALAGACAAAAGCGDDSGIQPGTLRFGQIGEVRLQLTTPLLLDQGQLVQSLVWSSSGPWRLTESMSYRRGGQLLHGLEVSRLRSVNADFYARWITQVNDDPRLRFVGDLDWTLDPECGPGRTKLRVLIRDAVLEEDRAWIRCAEGSLSTLVTLGAGPDPEAGRVAQAALHLRDYSVSPGFRSTFHGSLPFATLAEGEHTPVVLDAPLVIETPQAWRQFWINHTGSTSGLPTVDFAREVVIVGAVGQRLEAGEAVEVRRVLPVGDGTLVEVAWTVPGNFCSPVARTHRPFHAVVAPQVPRPITFSQIQREEVPCGA